MTRDVRFWIKIVSIGLVILMLGGYILFVSRDFIRGPLLEISSPQDGITVTSPLLTIQGTAGRISYLTLQGRSIFTNEYNQFSDQLLLYPGYNIITLEAKDRFGRIVQKNIGVVYQPEHVRSYNYSSTTPN